jgi:signal transduction histidine kinase/CheY-like chemotaxis protein
VLGGVAGLVVLMVLWWERDRRLRQQRETLRRSYQLGEEVLGASSVESICRRISEVLPRIFGISQVALYTHNRAARTLECVPGGAGESMIELASPPAGPQAGVAACFHYRTLLAIPDTARSPFPVAPSEGSGGPKAILYVPMFAQGEVVGVFEMDQNDRTREFRRDEQALAQHLGNQIGAAIRLLDQRVVQEQLFRTEKVAAVGRLISGVVNELEAPLASITDYAEQALGKAPECAVEREIQAIAAEARKAAAMVTRLVSFAGAEQAEARPVELNGLLRNLIEFRENEWKARCIRVREFISRDRLTMLGSQGQLEEVFLNLLVHAEQALAEQAEKTIVVRSGLLGKRVLIEITFSGPRTGPDPFAPGQGDAPGLSLCRSVIAGHGGQIRLVQTPTADPRFEVELPCAPRERAGPPEGRVGRPVSRRATALVIDSDEVSQRHLMGLLSARGYRVVPVGSADVGLDLAQRMRFDAAFCSVHAPGLNWVELSERLKARLDAFVLMSDGYNAELSADFAGEGRFVLPRPLQEHELDRLLEAIVPVVSGA